MYGAVPYLLMCRYARREYAIYLLVYRHVPRSTLPIVKGSRADVPSN